jgi:hypothetical protein
VNESELNLHYKEAHFMNILGFLQDEKASRGTHGDSGIWSLWATIRCSRSAIVYPIEVPKMASSTLKQCRAKTKRTDEDGEIVELDILKVCRELDWF